MSSNKRIREESHRSSFMKEESKSALYQKAVRCVAELIEAEGLDVAERAVAEALATPRSEAFVKRYGVSLSQGAACLKRLTGGKHIGTVEHAIGAECRAPSADHDTLWLKGGKPHIYMSEPYSLGLKAIGKMHEVATALGLDVRVTADSPYFPGRTLQVLFTKENRHD